MANQNRLAADMYKVLLAWMLCEYTTAMNSTVGSYLSSGGSTPHKPATPGLFHYLQFLASFDGKS